MPSLDKSHFCIFSFGLPRLSTDTTQTFVTQCELWKPCCCYRCFLSALLWKKSAHVTVDLTGRDLIQIKNRAALGKHSITHGVAKLVEYDNREQHCVDYLTCFLFSWLRFLIFMASDISALIHSVQLACACVWVCLHGWCNKKKTFHSKWTCQKKKTVIWLTSTYYNRSF